MADYISKIQLPEGTSYNFKASALPSGVTSGDGSAYTVTVSPEIALDNLVTILVKFNVTNTSAAPTLNVNSLGAKQIDLHSSEAYIILAGVIYALVYNSTSTKWELVNPNIGYRYNAANGAFAEGDRDIDESGTVRHQSVATGVMAHAEGCDGTASGNHSHTEGNLSNSAGNNSHAEGYTTTSTGTNSHAEGRVTNSIGNNSHAEGDTTITYGANSHAEGKTSIASGFASHAEGDGCETGGNYASETTNPKTVDSRTAVAGDYAHAEGLATIAYGINSHAEGQQTFAKGNYTHAEGFGSIVLENSAHAEGVRTLVNVKANGSHTEGYECETGGSATSNTKTASTTTNVGAFAHAEGNATIANGIAAHSEGLKTLAKGNNSHAEGNTTTASGANSHAEGVLSQATGALSHAEGRQTRSYAANSHAEGSTCYTLSSAESSHSEGYLCDTGGNATTNTKTAGTASGAGAYAHAEGNSTIANGVAAHSEGCLTLSKGNYSHTEGYGTFAWHSAHAEGRFTKALCIAEHAQGSLNVSHHATDTFDGNVGNTVHSIGIGVGNESATRKNAVEVMQNGDMYLYGVKYDGIHIKNETGAPADTATLLETIADTVTTSDVQTVQDIDLDINARIPLIDKTADTATSFTLEPNKMYKFGERTTLTISLDTEISGIVNEYMFEFESGSSTATTLSVPSGIIWMKTPDIQTGKIYQVSIENNLGLIGEWSNE